MPRLHAVAFVHWLCSSSGHWDSMEEYTCMIPRDTHDGAFYRAVLALHQDLFSLAQQVSCGAAENVQRWTHHPQTSPQSFRSCSLYINQCIFLEKEHHGGAGLLSGSGIVISQFERKTKTLEPCTHRNV